MRHDIFKNKGTGPVPWDIQSKLNNPVYPTSDHNANRLKKPPAGGLTAAHPRRMQRKTTMRLDRDEADASKPDRGVMGS